MFREKTPPMTAMGVRRSAVMPAPSDVLEV